MGQRGGRSVEVGGGCCPSFSVSPFRPIIYCVRRETRSSLHSSDLRAFRANGTFEVLHNLRCIISLSVMNCVPSSEAKALI